MNANTHEVVVVGAGPAGSVAAAVLAKQGCHVLLLDKAKFPRDKTCGDAIGWSSMKLLSDLGLSLESKRQELYVCDKVRAISPNGYVFEGLLPQKDGYRRYGYVVPRKDFDYLLWEFALQQGVRFEQLCVIEPIIERNVVCGVRGSLDGEAVERRARITIGADGANSIIARSLRPGKAAARHRSVALRAYFNGVQDLDHCMEFYFDHTMLRGYGWIFPFGDGMANIGVGLRLDTFYKNGKSLRQVFERFTCSPLVAKRLSKAMQVGEARGWTLSHGPQQLQRAYRGALLVGDAGAFVSPLTGAGIPNALETGRIAAEVALKALQGNSGSLDELHEFEIKWKSVLGQKLGLEAILRALLSWPGILDLMIREMCRSERFAHFVLTRL